MSSSNQRPANSPLSPIPLAVCTRTPLDSPDRPLTKDDVMTYIGKLFAQHESKNHT